MSGEGPLGGPRPFGAGPFVKQRSGSIAYIIVLDATEEPEIDNREVIRQVERNTSLTVETAGYTNQGKLPYDGPQYLVEVRGRTFTSDQEDVINAAVEGEAGVERNGYIYQFRP